MARREVPPSAHKGVRPPARRWRRLTPQLQSDLAVALPGAGTRVVGLAAPEGGGRCLAAAGSCCRCCGAPLRGEGP